MSAWVHGVYEYLVRRTKPVKSCISIGVACKFSSGNFYALQSVQQVQVLLKLLCIYQHCPRRQGCRANKYRQRDGSLRSPPLLPALGAAKYPTPSCMRIKTDRTVIEVLGKEESELMLKYHLENKEHLEQWEPTRKHDYFTLHNFSQMLSDNHRFLDNKTAVKLAALTPDRNEIIGVCNFTNIVFGPFQACNLGYSIAAKHQGKGLMTEILTSAIDQIFREFNLHRIMANYIPTNARSAAVLNKLGFEREGLAKSYLQIAGKWQDHILTSKINPQH
ncbi:GNAT family N-acetyltransferase [Endozoicomonas sp. ALB032]|uniref:GNAT family N-acetyltransferase n=1 Tax=Endozoicomonas sp. ALB032 TaxID=3403082 RepID=UPI003BB609F9